jgi:hypothetical protein
MLQTVLVDLIEETKNKPAQSRWVIILAQD